jgi:hypothetical protein
MASAIRSREATVTKNDDSRCREMRLERRSANPGGPPAMLSENSRGDGRRPCTFRKGDRRHPDLTRLPHAVEPRSC